MTSEEQRLEESRDSNAHWKRWGPYLSERAWGTVREDYSADGTAWEYLPHDHARSRAYRWNEDGIAGICDRHQKICFALALWNGRDPILKERLFGLTGNEGNHGEDVKECYFYLDSTPTHSYMKYLYKYPQAAFPYEQLVRGEPPTRHAASREFELMDTGVFDDNRYFDVFVEYAKASPDDILIRITVANRGPEAADLHLLPTVWFRNTWSWGSAARKPALREACATAASNSTSRSTASAGCYCRGRAGAAVHRERDQPAAALRVRRTPRPTSRTASTITSSTAPRRGQSRADGHQGGGALPADASAPGETVTLRLRLTRCRASEEPFGAEFDGIFADRMREADEFYATVIPRISPTTRAT